ncbi:ribosome recycling factor domain-containing protein [Coccidioides immitis RS]|uniref:Ribosome recycling factor n=3 Tax=Coccidioides immitis TaxID=5501 RepID=J3KL01_COCIM|nr:ribosome recycling factor domain-containing protein [Coccidioides immitis RS]EAS36914.3 ribosome recycling factor [Coccidioides immitis RS]KMP09824.1 hypothetical protein CIRG_09057 [Coccidioides immitis RMSCC 2394]KMU91977.1 hypothetical protein CIHG_09821 [Coccidioides immitis H538.4]TPX25035.1 hypothetical protein DIZ76_010484 [Coccidioides immitis]
MSPPFRIGLNGAARALCRCNHGISARPVVIQPLRHHASRSRACFNIRAGPLDTRATVHTLHSARPFSTSFALSKKKKDKSSHASEEPSADGNGEDPFDFSSLSNGIQDALSRLKEDVSKLRVGGRLNPELIENVRVTLKTSASSGKEKETVRLSELAQVIPKGGRMVTILVGEEEFIKPITSALQAVPSLSLNPQPDPHNKLQLNLPIPPPTRESRDQAVKDAKAAMEKASASVKNARANMNKKLKALGNKKAVRPDDLRKALEQMEKLAEKGQKDVKDAFESAKKALERE